MHSLDISDTCAAIVEPLGRLPPALQTSRSAQKGLANALIAIPGPKGQYRLIANRYCSFVYDFPLPPSGHGPTPIGMVYYSATGVCHPSSRVAINSAAALA